MNRPRLLYFFACGIVIALGLASRRFGHALPHFLALYAGDTLWALLIFLGVGFLFPRWPSRRVFAFALLFCFADEASQLYHAPWLDALRHTRLGALVLGYDFLWSDLVCYTVGVTLGWLAEKTFLEKLLNASRNQP
ncbi:MAG: hypothetical protein RLZZ350_874 [Verrucomicrobiota bacterium]|jgi:hypothetical protein